MMRCNLLIALTLIALAGCTGREFPNQTSGAAVTAAQTPETSPAQPCTNQTGYQILPPDVTLAIPYHLRADRLYTNSGGKSRRRIVLEYLQGDLDSTLQSVQESLTVAGFTSKPLQTKDGTTKVAFSKKGYGTVNIILNPLVGAKPSNPAARGVLTMDFPGPVSSP